MKNNRINRKGFTLVELLAVIVILAVIMIVAIPSVLETMNTARKKSFLEYAEKVSTLGEQYYLKDQMTSSFSNCVIYDIEKDLGLGSTGDYHGYVIVVKDNNDTHYYVTLYDENFMIYGIEIDNNFTTDNLQDYTSSSDQYLTKEYLAGLANCSTYTNKSDGSSGTATVIPNSERSNVVSAWAYNEDSSASNYCITGNESTCETTTCYKKGTCGAGTIIDYKVNNSTTVRFHVLHDNGSTLTLQSQKNTLDGTMWHSAHNATQGPTIAIPALEEATNDWSNVNTLTYELGSTVLYKSAYTKCETYNSCSTNAYTFGTRTAKARLVTLLEVSDIGCTTTQSTCPKFLYNYLDACKRYGCTETGTKSGYWTYNASGTSYAHVWLISQKGYVYYGIGASSEAQALRAVVEINKQ